MTFKNWEKRKKLNKRLLQPRLPVCGSEINAILAGIVALYFPEIKTLPSVYFGRTPTLAHIEDSHLAEQSAIWLHDALNDSTTPDYVLRFIITHELLHTRIRPREVDGEWMAHPPEFWEEEKRIAKSDITRAWDWIYGTVGRALKRDKDAECIWVNNKMIEQILQNRGCTEKEIDHLREAFRLAPGELRFGFRDQIIRAIANDKD